MGRCHGMRIWYLTPVLKVIRDCCVGLSWKVCGKLVVYLTNGRLQVRILRPWLQSFLCAR